MNPSWVTAMRLANQRAVSSGLRMQVVKRKGWLAVYDLFHDGVVGYNIHPVGDDRPGSRTRVPGVKCPFNFGLAT